MSVKKAPMNVYGARTIGICAVCVGMLLSVPVHALSLGGFQVKSALDEPLEAEITLNSADAETLESLEVTLGSRDDFGRAEVPRAEFLQMLQFEVVSDGGEPVVRVTTEQPVKEPFLHFLIAAEWSGGKLVREYTGLLDPPLYAAESPSSVVAPDTGGSMGEATQPVSPEPAETASSTGTSTSTSGTSMVAAPGRSAEYGPTQEGDTLWGIASKLQTGALQVNVFQIMIALLRENPDAFIDNNINRLKTGQILSVQDLGDIAGINPGEASAIYTAQLEEWQSYRTRVADAGGEEEMSSGASTAMTTPSATEQAAANTTETAAAETGQTPETQAGSQQSTPEEGDDEVLRIVQATLDESQESETAGSGADRSGEIAEMRGQIATLEESLESRNLANQELQERVRLLESQLENARRLIEIESEDLAAAQEQAAERQNEAAMAEASDEAQLQSMAQEEAQVEAQVEDQEAEQAQGQSGDINGAGDGEQMAGSEPEPASTAGGETPDTGEQAQSGEDTSAGQQASAAATPASQDSTQAAQESEKVRKVVSRPPQSSWWSSLPDMLFSSWMWMVGAGVGVLVLVLGLLMFLRRRQSIAEFEESILSGSALDSYSETTDTAGSSASDTSFLSDFGTAGMGTMQADEVDPLAEAEVYLAYGRDEQAEEVLKEAARRDPERAEVKLKLLEIYKQRNDVKSFETIAEELYPASEQEDPEIWRQVNAMGRELNPDNPLFHESGTGTITEPGTNTEPGKSTPAAATAPRPAVAAEPEPEVEALNFDLDDFGGDDTQSTAASEPVEQEQKVETVSLDMDMDTSPEPAAPETVAPSDGDNDTLEFTDDFLETASKTVDPSAQPFPTPDQQTDLDRELERLAGEREPAAPTQVRPAVELPDAGGDADRKVQWETAQGDAQTLDFPASDPSEIDFDLNLDESSIPSDSDSEPATGEEPGKLNNGEGLLEFESENIPPEETWAGPSSDASPGSGDDELAYSPDDDIQSGGAPQYNEAETKLDLARAYLDMGDKVGARSIIDEVMREGDPAQRDRAAELASQL